MGWFNKYTALGEDYNYDLTWMARPGVFSMGLANYGSSYCVEDVDYPGNFWSASIPADNQWNLLAMAVLSN
jgi:hypothetical protein